jgi:hypothetical protein
MLYISKELEKQIPPIRSQEDVEDPMVICKLFMPGTDWKWFVVEGEQTVTEEQEDDFLFFGLVHGHELELGYFLLSELLLAWGPLGIGATLDKGFEQVPISVIRKRYSR